MTIYTDENVKYRGVEHIEVLILYNIIIGWSW